MRRINALAPNLQGGKMLRISLVTVKVRDDDMEA